MSLKSERSWLTFPPRVPLSRYQILRSEIRLDIREWIVRLNDAGPKKSPSWTPDIDNSMCSLKNRLEEAL